jgi:hypothetical protein
VFSFAYSGFEITPICFGHQFRIIYKQNAFRPYEIIPGFVGRNPANRFIGRLITFVHFRAARETAIPWLRCVKQFEPAPFDQWRRIRFKRLPE